MSEKISLLNVTGRTLDIISKLSTVKNTRNSI